MVDATDIDELQPPIYSFTEGRMMTDVVWKVEDGGLISPKTGKKCKLTKSKAGKTIMAYDVIRGPYFIAVPGTDENGDGNFDCCICRDIDQALRVLEEKPWNNPENLKKD